MHCISEAADGLLMCHQQEESVIAKHARHLG